MYWSKLTGAREDERGFTLQELLTTIAILAILIAIAVIIFLALLERWRVDAATTQLVGDLRHAHGGATNQLTDWRVVLALDRAEQEEGPDYYLVRLAEPYDSGDSGPAVTGRFPRTFPGDVKATNVITPAGSVVDDQGANYWAPPWDAAPSPPVPQTRTLEFNTDGTMTFFRSPSGSACVTVDGSPKNRVISISATSRVRVELDTCASG
ncbi:MAG: prepilin-type N-terminal cleavage/methylation domain-containing protein [Actinobacteria bacterium]|nr:prepilin-type N-terminal cleavage/methylation domain-containing protein [Actinomycetota bacterium]